jgi:hypothetical protein
MAFTLVRYSQQDPAWKNNLIAHGPDTIGYIGCALTCVAMYSSGWGYTETPATLNLKLASHGGYVHEAIVWGAITQFHPKIRSTGLTLCMTTDAPLAQIDASIAAGQPVIVEVDYSPEAGLQTHWLLVYGKKDNDYLVQDPWPCPPEVQPVTLLSRYGHGQPLRRAIKAVAWFMCDAGEPIPPTPPPAPVNTDLVLQPLPTATAGIKLRNAPSADALADYAEMPGMLLSVIEEKAGALAKLGQMDQWIYVRDPNGHQGWVAAWYVQVAPVPAPTPPPAPTPVPSTPPAPKTPPASEPRRMQVVVLDSVGKGGLAVRQQPSLGSDKVNNEKAGARLTVVEPPDVARTKIGVAGQWLGIKATNNKRGYVMAQYVKLLK